MKVLLLLDGCCGNSKHLLYDSLEIGMEKKAQRETFPSYPRRGFVQALSCRWNGGAKPCRTRFVLHSFLEIDPILGNFGNFIQAIAKPEKKHRI